MYKKAVIAAIVLIGLLIAGFTPFYTNHNDTAQNKPSQRVRKIQEEVLKQVISFRDYINDTFFADVKNEKIDTQKLRHDFLQSRLLFKKFEWAATYFASELTERLNGPPVQEIENADLLDSTLARAIDPMGLQVIEQLIYPEYDTADKKELVSDVEHLITNTNYLVAYFSDHDLADWRILDAAKLEIFRIIALGITGYDNGLSLNSMEESAASLQSLRDMLTYYVHKNDTTFLLQDLDSAIEYLQQHQDFDSFDRMEFITRYANKISSRIAQIQRALDGYEIKYNRMLKQDVNTLFDTDAFNVDAFTPGPEFHITAAKVELGEKLFYDASLAGTGTRSCASCHQPDKAFTDGLTKNTDIHDSSKLIERNVPTLINAALQSNYFYDMRALTLEDQANDVINNKMEMGGSMDAVIKYVGADKTYKALFAKAFPGKKENDINADEVKNALASYVRSLVKLNSRFDEYMQGDKQSLSNDEVKGFNLFMGKAKCATCHFIPLFNGITPPKYVMSETEVLGVPVSFTDSTLDADMGYYDVIGVDSYKYAFKVPTIRNSDKTAPYMHNGAYKTLEQVMEFYDKGGGAGLGINLSNQTLPTEPLHLTEAEKEDIIAFIKSLESR
ncbi:MAG: c-type cytochrome [Bacteroidetes bacterium]|nr:c-type cytochrome [Bacteroidota bacterium]